MQFYLLGREDHSTVATRLNIRSFAVFSQTFWELTSHSSQLHEEEIKFTCLNTDHHSIHTILTE